MGEVYRARDGKLGRDVAIKILPSHFTADPERRMRSRVRRAVLKRAILEKVGNNLGTLNPLFSPDLQGWLRLIATPCH